MNDGVFICTCNVKSDEYKCWKKYAFVYDSHFKPLHESKFCGSLVDNRADAPIFVLEYKDNETKKLFRFSLIEFFAGLCHVGYV